MDVDDMTMIDPTTLTNPTNPTNPMTYSSVIMPSTFPVSQRPIYLHPTASVSNKEKETAYPQIAQAVSRVLIKHPDDRILVHTVSYELNTYLAQQLEGTGRISTYHTPLARQSAI
ncbi:MAG: hypothetical protein ACREBW_08570, partial [Candidatus Micrarchaeaceae archaeon]